ncbi:Endonuclease/exonuclease/phosphatase [Apodospora peruviana]|uniref:Endonuclease/exonuclease/phosphatase n=1 Tax=Apodospora peruviana TaxID=516989 RepID=A0AAE0ITC0_9PEZI|nr:Endonuclease/exonuclease/phosphatase [Apodospora peruviana]
MNPPRTLLSTLFTTTTNNSLMPAPDADDNMAMTPPSTLDLFILTFNCAKNLINVPVFSAHLQAALTRNAESLPDLVAFSLQEVSPLSYAFIGSYFLNSYYSKYEEALNLASVNILETTATSQYDVRPQQQQTKKPYTLVRAKNVGMTAILLFARDLASVRRIEEAECGFGAAEMGNKGAVGLRVSWAPAAGAGGEETEVTVVATHLAAMEWNLKKRNANWRSIMSSLTFANPKELLPGVFPADNAPPSPDHSGVGDKFGPPSASQQQAYSSEDTSEADDEEDGTSSSEHPLLLRSSQGSSSTSLAPEHHATLRDASVFKPSSHLFVAGDLNYRISSSTPPPLAPFPSFDASSPDYYTKFLCRDQLMQERLAGRTFHGMSEPPVAFGPTYKYNVLSDAEGAANEAAVRAGVKQNGIPEVPWKFAAHRWPGWCDRVLFLDLPRALKRQGSGGKGGRVEIEVQAYDAMPVVRTSDHRAVFLRVKVPVLGAEAMRRGLQLEEGDGDDGDVARDPRASPPLPVDVHAWERRAAARRKEIMVGWTALLWSTQEGALFMATMLVLTVGSWWLWRVW